MTTKESVSNPMSDSLPDCNCTSMYLGGATPGWWCPAHKDRIADKFAAAALREKHKQLLDAQSAIAAAEAERDALRRALDGVLACIGTPNPQDPSLRRVMPGMGLQFSDACRAAFRTRAALSASPQSGGTT